MSVNMVRPPWHTIQEMLTQHPSVVICSCGQDLSTERAVREHWQLGHFDYVEGEKITKITPDLDRRVQAERRREPRERILDLERQVSKLYEIVNLFANFRTEGELKLAHFRAKEYIDELESKDV